MLQMKDWVMESQDMQPVDKNLWETRTRRDLPYHRVRDNNILLHAWLGYNCGGVYTVS